MTPSEEQHLEEIITRRCANTGETREEARAIILERMGDVRAEAERSQAWVAVWIVNNDGPCGDEGREEAARTMGWIQHLARTPWKRALVLKFPPSCVVRSKPDWTHQIPAKGTCGLVIGFSRSAESEFVDVAPGPNGPRVFGQCPAESLEIVGYHDGWTPERVLKVIEAMSEDALR